MESLTELLPVANNRKQANNHKSIRVIQSEAASEGLFLSSTNRKISWKKVAILLRKFIPTTHIDF